MMSQYDEPSGRERKCAGCDEPIHVGDVVVVLAEGLAHQRCCATPDDVADRITDFLNRVPTGSFCNICIAGACSLPYQDVAKTIARLRLRPDLRLLIGARCSRCTHVRITIGVRPGQETPKAIG